MSERVHIMVEKISIKELTKNGVTVVREKFSNNGERIGSAWFRGYSNSLEDRASLENEVSNPFQTAIFTIWGDEPTVVEQGL